MKNSSLQCPRPHVLWQPFRQSDIGRAVAAKTLRDLWTLGRGGATGIY
jgi:hypothetical protein